RIMQEFTARYVGRPDVSTSTIATVHAPQSPSAQPSFVPVRPVERSHWRSVVLIETPSTVTGSPLTMILKDEGKLDIAPMIRRPELSYPLHRQKNVISLSKRILAMILHHSLAGKQLFTILNIAAAAVLSGVIMSVQAAVPQLDAEAMLARAATAYYEARFSDTIAILTPLNPGLEGQPGRVPDLIRTKLQLALAHIGLNQLAQAKTLFSELRELDPQFSLDETKFAPKVIALFEEAKISRDERKCEICDSIFEEAVEAY